MTEQREFDRRRVLALGGALAGTAGLGLVGCSSDSDSTSTASASGSPTPSSSPSASASPSASPSATATGTCVLTANVTEGPYYLDGALFREDITEGKEGVPLTVRLTVQDTTGSCAPVADAAVEIWHCDAWGYYSGFTTTNPGGSGPDESEDTSGANDKTFLRGYQMTDADGIVTIKTIFPGWYTPRVTHIHVKVHTGGKKQGDTYEGGKVNHTGQLFFDDKYGDAVYKLKPYSQHTGNRTLLDDDMVYGGDGSVDGLMAVTGDTDNGYTGVLLVGLDPDTEATGAGGGGGPQ
ncbi:intradiol ring-cleavage dioxygenase [Streptomyces beijiangensis]|uniref:Intradiol ring-cleavage dioxygenase n=1 Tax=Streptomyces beijiangensis TaxID=163361 RepID=A0A939FFH9_9ACTN|nr:intradiol ring-cleavage dioxygenase [Streptomyces beijiangensis]MBO0517642.1 intradiol ring-cleavage dioxygenase [Streptomyces beijiangensis]